MIINKDNYEAFLLDLSEGNLSVMEEQALYSFLNNHPELDSDLLDVLPELKPSPQLNYNKDHLLFESPNVLNRSYFFIAALEDELNEKEKQQLDAFLIDHPQFKKEFNQFKRTKLTHDGATIKDKEPLLAIADPVISRKTFYTWTIRAVGIIVLFMSIYYFNQQTNQVEITSLDTNSNKNIEKSDSELINKNSASKKEENLASKEMNTAKTTLADHSLSSKKKNDKVKQKEPEIIKDNNSNFILPINETSKNEYFIEEFSNKQVKSQNLVDLVAAIDGQKKETVIAHADEELKNNTIQENKEQTLKDYLIGNVKSRIPIPQNNDYELLTIANFSLEKLSKKEQYIAKREDNQIKTQLAIGPFKFERIKRE